MTAPSDNISDYQKLMTARFKEFEADIQKLEAKAETAGAEARIELKNQANDFRRRLADMRSQLDKLSQSSGEAWENMRSGLDDAWSDLSEAWKKTKSTF